MEHPWSFLLLCGWHCWPSREPCFLISLSSKSWKRNSLPTRMLAFSLQERGAILNKPCLGPAAADMENRVFSFFHPHARFSYGLGHGTVGRGHTACFPEAWLISKAVPPKGSLFAWAWTVTRPTAQILKQVSRPRLRATGQDAYSWGRREDPLQGAKLCGSESPHLLESPTWQHSSV